MATSKRYIFLVDDEPIQNEMLKDYLSERFAYDLKVFDNGEDALQHMSLHPEIVVLDFHLSGHNKNARNGVDILKEIKDKYPDTQVIMLSGQDKIEVAVDSIKYGAYDYVVKGETAFSRMDVFNNIGEFQKMKLVNKGQRMIITILSLVVIAAVLLAIYLGVFTNAYHK